MSFKIKIKVIIHLPHSKLFSHVTIMSERPCEVMTGEQTQVWHGFRGFSNGTKFLNGWHDSGTTENCTIK